MSRPIPANLSSINDETYPVDHSTTSEPATHNEPPTLLQPASQGRQIQSKTHSRGSGVRRGLQRTQRTKVSRACDNCKNKKIRCSGNQPCVRCVDLGIPCQYLAIYTRGRLPSTQPSVSHGRHSTPQLPLESPRAIQVIDQSSVLLDATISEDVNANISSRNSPVPSANIGGQYHGPSSPITFLERAWRRFKQNYVSSSLRNLDKETTTEKSVLVFDDNQSPRLPDNTLSMPSKPIAKKLVDKYFEFSTAFFQFLHRDSVNQWIDGLYGESGRQHGQETLSVRKITLVLMIFAAATFDGVDDGPYVEDSEKSSTYLRIVQQRLREETGPPTLESVQTRIIECLYLLSTSHASDTYSKFGMTASMIITLGLHRRKRNGGYNFEIGLIEHECRKRTFWIAYILDRYLSLMGGRPRIIQDFDIDQELPARVDDIDLTDSEIRTRVGLFDSQMDAPLMHIKLMRISGQMSSIVYPLHSTSTDDRLAQADLFTKQLTSWKSEVPFFLRHIPASSLIPVFQRQSVVLRLAQAHTIIHATRPFLLSNFANGPSQNVGAAQKYKRYIYECVNAARDVVDLLDSIEGSDFEFHSWWFIQYVSFCAIAVLYIYTIQQHQNSISSPSDASSVVVDNQANRGEKDYFIRAECCQKRLAAEAKDNSPGKRYDIVLEELRLETHRHMPSPDSSLSWPVVVDDNWWNDFQQQDDADVSNFMAGIEMDVTSIFDNWAVPEWT